MGPVAWPEVAGGGRNRRRKVTGTVAVGWDRGRGERMGFPEMETPKSETCYL